VQTESSGQQASGFILKPNYPNPFNPDTNIPFVLEEELFEDGQPVVVSMEIFNVLAQPIAQPVALNHPMGPDAKMESLRYTAPGEYEAHWNGEDIHGRQVASGRYFLRVTLNGQLRAIMSMFVTK
jgi:hypothetical protein